MPVVSPVMMSVIAIARGSKPFDLNHCTMRSLPADVHSFAFFSSLTVLTGFFVKICVQPPLPQLTSTKPFASSRLASVGVSAAVTAFSSSYESKKNGTSKTLNAPSIVPRPTPVKAAACSASRRIFRRTVDSSPCEPPANTVSVTRPPVSFETSVLICRRLFDQMEPSGTTDASLMLTVCADGTSALTTTSAATARARIDRDTCLTGSLAGNPGLELFFFLEPCRNGLGLVLRLELADAHSIASRRRLAERQDEGVVAFRREPFRHRIRVRVAEHCGNLNNVVVT